MFHTRFIAEMKATGHVLTDHADQKMRYLTNDKGAGQKAQDISVGFGESSFHDDTVELSLMLMLFYVIITD